MLYAVEHTEAMDTEWVTDLATHMNEVIDIKRLGEELQRQPIVETPEGTWRALNEDEAIQVGRIVGEAIGARWLEPLR